MNQLVKELFEDMINIYRRANKECKYKPMRYLDKLVRDNDPVQTAVDLVVNTTEGFIRLMELNRLDLSVEALVLKDKYKGLFSENIKRICRDRLMQSGYNPDGEK